MDFVLRFILLLMTFATFLINNLLIWCVPRKKPTFPGIRNKLLTLSLGELITELRSKKLKSEQLVRTYIERIAEVNAALNAVVEHRFEDALKEAQHADRLIAEAVSNEQLMVLFARYPLLGIPFTVKEHCGVKGMSFTVGSVHRLNERSPDDGEVVKLLRTAGGIPLLVSANPEFCLSLETSSYTHGRCLNPYDLNRSAGGSSGGEGALNGSGASIFGVASDLSGSIRLPALFNGIFSHKATASLLSIRGVFPTCDGDKNFSNYLQLGPMSRFARDLPLLLQLMAGENAHKLQFSNEINVKDIKIHYALGFNGFNGFFHPTPSFDIKLAILRAVKCFEYAGLETKEFDNSNIFRHSAEIVVSGMVSMVGLPSIISQSSKTKPSTKVLVIEFIRSIIGHSLYTKESLFIELFKQLNSFLSAKKIELYKNEASIVRQKVIDLLGTNGVLFFPTFHMSAFHFNTSLINIAGADTMVMFTLLGLPSTHVPMGLDRNGMPIGFQVVAAPYQDRLCLRIAAELEVAFGGWIPPKLNEI